MAAFSSRAGGRRESSHSSAAGRSSCEAGKTNKRAGGSHQRVVFGSGGKRFAETWDNDIRSGGYARHVSRSVSARIPQVWSRPSCSSRRARARRGRGGTSRSIPPLQGRNARGGVTALMAGARPRARPAHCRCAPVYVDVRHVLTAKRGEQCSILRACHRAGLVTFQNKRTPSFSRSSGATPRKSFFRKGTNTGEPVRLPVRARLSAQKWPHFGH